MKRKHVAVKAFLLYRIDRVQFVLEVLRTSSTYSQEILTALLIFDHILLLIDPSEVFENADQLAADRGHGLNQIGGGCCGSIDRDYIQNELSVVLLHV